MNAWLQTVIVVVIALVASTVGAAIFPWNGVHEKVQEGIVFVMISLMYMLFKIHDKE